MPNPTDPDLLPGHCRRELRHMLAMGGWLTAGYFSGNYEPIGDALLAAEHIELAENDRIYRITDAGRAWLAGQGS